MVSKRVPKMTDSSATKAFWERIAQMEEMMGEWACEDDTMAS